MLVSLCRPHKPKQYEDMLISAQLPGHQVASDDDEDCRPAKIRATDSEMSYRSECACALLCTLLKHQQSSTQSWISEDIQVTCHSMHLQG